MNYEDVFEQKRLTAMVLTVCFLLCCTTVTAETTPLFSQETPISDITAQETPVTMQSSDLPLNIRALLPADKQDSSVYLASSEQLTAEEIAESAELFTIRVEDPLTGEGTMTVHSVPVKYVDSEGKLQFIDTAMKPLSVAQSDNGRYAYRNAANQFAIDYGKTATDGIRVDDDFIFVPLTETLTSRTGTVQIVDGHGSIVYPDVFGDGTRIEYTNTENGMKENIILDKYTGQNRFSFIFRSETHIPVLANDGQNVLITKKGTPEKADYRFLSLYAYDSYNPNLVAVQASSGFRHFNEDLRYELTANADGSYLITIVVPQEYLTHPEVVYPVTIDPPITLESSNSNSQDTFVSEETPTTQNNSGRDFLRFGKVNGYKHFAYHRFTTLPTLPTGANISSAYIKFTFRSGQTTPVKTANVKIWTLLVTEFLWSESTITWDTQPYGSSGPTTAITYTNGYLDYFNANITSLVREWYCDTPNFGIDFTYDNEDYNDCNTVVSSEGDASRAPILTINYTVYGATSGITNGQTYFIKNAYSGKYLEAELSLNNNVRQHTYTGASNQQWRVMYQGDGLYKLYNHSSFYSNGRYCLDLEGIHTNNIDLWNNCSEDYVLFNIFSNGDGTYRIQNYWPKSPKVLTVSSTSTSNVYNSDWSTSSKQRWVFEARSSKAVTAHSGQIQVGMSADNFGSSRNDTTCGYGFVVSTHTADGFGSSLLLDERINLKFYHLNYGSNHSAVWATKNDFLSKEYHSITDPNIDDVHFMLFVGHGLGKMLHFSHGPAGTNHADNKSQHFLTDLNFTLAEANFGYGDAITK